MDNLQPHNFFDPSLNEAALKCVCAGFKGLPNGTNFIMMYCSYYRTVAVALFIIVVPLLTLSK